MPELEYLSCDWQDCGNEVSYYCNGCRLVYCRQHVRRYDDQGKTLEQPMCLRCFPERKEPRHLQIGGPMSEQIATREWYTKARVRFLETVRCGNPEGFECTFHAGQELPMVQWGRAGRLVDRSHWWNNFDIDGAFIVDASKVEVIEVLEEVSPA